MLAPWFPAATTSRTPLSFACSTSSSSACDLDELAKEPLTILAPRSIAYSMPAITSEVDPDPDEFMNLIGIIWVDQQTPAIPVPLLPRAPMIPETCVPWP